jgi:hypothetical protein
MANTHSSGRSTGLKVTFIVGLLLGGWLVFSAFRSSHRGGEAGMEPDTGPLLLSIQKIGQLHTVTYNMKDVLRQVSESDPDGWVADLPGAADVVHWATHNEAVVEAQGNVEAGVNLAQITAKEVTRVRKPDGSYLVRVHLPPVTVYPPNVHLRVINDHPGLLWRDEQILPKAQFRAAQMFRDSARQGGIVGTAQANTIHTLQALESALGHKNVEFTF